MWTELSHIVPKQFTKMLTMFENNEEIPLSPIVVLMTNKHFDHLSRTVARTPTWLFFVKLSNMKDECDSEIFRLLLYKQLYKHSILSNYFIDEMATWTDHRRMIARCIQEANPVVFRLRIIGISYKHSNQQSTFRHSNSKLKLSMITFYISGSEIIPQKTMVCLWGTKQNKNCQSSYAQGMKNARIAHPSFWEF